MTNKYLNGVPESSRANDGLWFQKEFLSEDNLKQVHALDEIAKGRGQSLAQMAIAWVLRDRRITSALIGARNVVTVACCPRSNKIARMFCFRTDAVTKTGSRTT